MRYILGSSLIKLPTLWNKLQDGSTPMYLHRLCELLFNILTCGCCNYRWWWLPDANYRNDVHIILCVCLRYCMCTAQKQVRKWIISNAMFLTMTQLCVRRRRGWESTGISCYISEELRGNIIQPLDSAHTHT